MAENSIGALWLKDGKAGKYMTGEVEVNGEKQRIVVFKNTYKQQDKQPDYRILAARPKDASEQASQQPAQPSGDFEDDIPF